MRRAFFLLLLIAGFLLLRPWLEPGKNSRDGTSTPGALEKTAKLDSTTHSTWGNPASLPDHFARHGRDFGARNADEYARMASEFLRRGKASGLPAKLDADGTLRVFDPAKGAFAAYNRDGTTKTFFKPGSRDYFQRQPGRLVNLKTIP